MEHHKVDILGIHYIVITCCLYYTVTPIQLRYFILPGSNVLCNIVCPSNAAPLVDQVNGVQPFCELGLTQGVKKDTAKTSYENIPTQTNRDRPTTFVAYSIDFAEGGFMLYIQFVFAFILSFNTFLFVDSSILVSIRIY